MLNRSPHQEKVASPDVIEFMRAVAQSSTEETKKEIDEFLAGISSGSTRELIADPATLGALRQNTIMKALATISDDLLDNIKSLKSQLSRIAGINPTIMYLGLFVIGALVIFLVYQTIQMDLGSIAEQVKAIYKSLGIQP